MSRRNKNMRYWLDNQHEFENILINHSKSYIRNYISTVQENKCKICGWNNKK